MPGGLKNSTSFLPMQKLGYQKMLECMSNEPVVDLASIYHGEYQVQISMALVCGLFGNVVDPVTRAFLMTSLLWLGLLFTIGRCMLL